MNPQKQPSPRAIATRSLTLAGRLTGKERDDAFKNHAALIWPAKACTMNGHTTRF